MFPIFALVAPCRPGASAPLMLKIFLRRDTSAPRFSGDLAVAGRSRPGVAKGPSRRNYQIGGGGYGGHEGTPVDTDRTRGSGRAVWLQGWKRDGAERPSR